MTDHARAIEAGARAIHIVENSDDYPFESVAPDTYRKFAKACIEAALASGALVPASAVAAEREREETGWLVEKDDPPVYAILSDWTSDANKALRFARREDAQTYADHVGWTSPPIRIVEHLWTDGVKPKVIAFSNGHRWIKAFNLTCCRDCGIVRRADDKNSSCKGAVKVGPRALPPATASGEFVVVPRKLTPDMIVQGYEHVNRDLCEGKGDALDRLWTAMLNAATKDGERA